MRRIRKTHAPHKLTEWCDENKDLNHSYDDLCGTEAHRSLKDKLLIEQGYLCAYTGRSIKTSSSHVEHLKPQNSCDEWEDVDYRNVVVCFPSDGGDTSHGYGAPVKGKWWDEELFVSPLSEDCEGRFEYAWSGHVRPLPDNHAAASETIKRLGLDADELWKLRRARINGFFGYGARSRSKELSIADAQQVLNNIDHADGNGRLIEFCFVLKQLLPKYIAKGGAA